MKFDTYLFALNIIFFVDVITSLLSYKIFVGPFYYLHFNSLTTMESQITWHVAKVTTIYSIVDNVITN